MKSQSVYLVIETVTSKFDPCVFSKHTDKFIIVTNQSGLASGKIDIENLEEINSFIYKEFEKRNLPLKKIYFSENYDEGYDSMRKPGIGMFVKAKEDFNINLSKSLKNGKNKMQFCF